MAGMPQPGQRPRPALDMIMTMQLGLVALHILDQAGRHFILLRQWCIGWWRRWRIGWWWQWRIGWWRQWRIGWWWQWRIGWWRQWRVRRRQWRIGWWRRWRVRWRRDGRVRRRRDGRVRWRRWRVRWRRDGRVRRRRDGRVRRRRDGRVRRRRNRCVRRWRRRGIGRWRIQLPQSVDHRLPAVGIVNPRHVFGFRQSHGIGMAAMPQPGQCPRPALDMIMTMRLRLVAQQILNQAGKGADWRVCWWWDRRIRWRSGRVGWDGRVRRDRRITWNWTVCRQRRVRRDRRITRN